MTNGTNNGRIAVLTVGGAAATALAHFALAPQLGQLTEAVGLHAEVGYAVAYVVLAASLISAGSNDRSISRGLWVLTACVFMARGSVVMTATQADASAYEAKANAAKAAHQAALATYAAAVEARNETIAAAKGDPDINAKAPYLKRKAQARQRLADALALPVPAKPALTLPQRPSTSWLDIAVQIAGPAGTEAVTAFLVKAIGTRIGAGWLFVLAPLFVRRRTEVIEAADALAVKESALAGLERQLAEANKARAMAEAQTKALTEELKAERGRTWAIVDQQVREEQSARDANEKRRAKRREADRRRRADRKKGSAKGAALIEAAKRFRVVA
ncbi:MAG: hypothetical protein AAFN74_02155 [Myxococcota bacterium]